MVQAELQKREVRIGEYVLTGKIGQGGIAEIFKGRQASLDRDVAIKILSAGLSSDPELVRRFERESIVIAKLNHPNIVHVIDKGRAGNRYYFVMEFVDGTSLREVIDSTKIPLNTKIEMLEQVCKALDYAHKNGVIHRDIKPANILLDKQGNVRVADFGIAQIIGTPETEMTSSDVIMGTLAYMSPEQKVSSTNVDQTTDIYAVGVILYEMLVGKKPLGRFKMPSEIDPTIDSGFDRIIQRCLAQDSKDRYQDSVSLKNDLLNVIGGKPNGKSEDDSAIQGSESFIGKCRHLDTIRETRYSSTILVENKVTKKLYVIKTHSRGESGRKEAMLLESLHHKNIISIVGSGGDKRSTVIISEYAQGGSLAERMVRKYDWEKGMHIALEIAAGLDFAHKNNITHGNLRPANVLFTADEEVKLTDFGLTPHYDAAGKKNWFSPPEHKISKLGDIYGLGVILHMLITGQRPGYDSSGGLLVQNLKGKVPNEVLDMLRRLVAIRVSNRYQTAEELLLDWEEFEQTRLRQSETRSLPVTSEPEVKPSIPASLYLGGAIGAILLAILVVYLIKSFG